MFYFVSAWIPPFNIQQTILSVYIHATAFASPTEQSKRMMAQTSPHIATQLGAMLYGISRHVEMFLSLRGCALPAIDWNNFCMVIYEELRPAMWRVRIYQRAEALEITATIPGEKGGIVERHDIVPGRQHTLSWAGN